VRAVKKRAAEMREMTKNSSWLPGPIASRRTFLRLAGLAGSSTGTATASSSLSGIPVKGGTLLFAWLGAPESLDPHLIPRSPTRR
jgi:hypothetical protein